MRPACNGMGCHDLVGPGNNETDKPIYPPERGRDRGLGFPGASPAPCMRLLPHVLHAVVTAELQECCAESRLLPQSCKNDFLLSPLNARFNTCIQAGQRSAIEYNVDA